MKAFSDKEWAIADIEHFGKSYRWSEESVYIKAVENDQIVGMIHLMVIADVAEIITLITSHNHRHEGVGSSLIKKAETVAKQKGVHKFFLYTGKGWKSVEFYKKHGFEQMAELKNHIRGRDWLLMTKDI